jgi:hypothetical protein
MEQDLIGVAAVGQAAVVRRKKYKNQKNQKNIKTKKTSHEC